MTAYLLRITVPLLYIYIICT